MSHNTEEKKEYECLTPKDFLRSLGEFTLDPCAPIIRPWDMATHHYTIEDDGLNQEWFGRVWMNSPYGKYLPIWLQKMNLHRNGIALLPSRTGTPWFHRQVYEQADAIYYLEDRIWFRKTDGTKIGGNAGHDSILLPYGKKNIEAIMDSGQKGHMELLRSVAVIVVTESGSWRTVITRAISKAGNEANVQEIYELVELIAPDKKEKNKHWREKIRQQLQYHFTRISEGRYSNKKAEA